MHAIPTFVFTLLSLYYSSQAPDTLKNAGANEWENEWWMTTIELSLITAVMPLLLYHVHKRTDWTDQIESVIHNQNHIHYLLGLFRSIVHLSPGTIGISEADNLSCALPLEQAEHLRAVSNNKNLLRLVITYVNCWLGFTRVGQHYPSTQ